MSTYQLTGYNYLILPNLDVMLRLESGRNIFIKDKYLRWFALFCFLSGIRSIYTMSFNLPEYFLKIKNFVKNFVKKFFHSLPAAGMNQYVVIFGFGDSEAGLSILKYFSKLGYNFLLMNNRKLLNFRQTHNLDKIEEIDELPNKIVKISYEDFKEEFNNLTKDQEIFVEYIFDCSIFRVITEINPYDPVVENNSYSEEENSIFHRNQITSALEQFISIFEMLKMRMIQFKIFSVEFLSKSDDVNHKLLFDLKYSVMENFLKIYRSLVQPGKVCYLRKIKIKNQNNKLEESEVAKSLYENF
jgi:hypothetical protein